MPRAVILPSAEADLAEIWEYIARDSLVNADRFVRRIFQTCHETLATNPPIGHTREELSPGLRSFVLQDYIIFYRPIENGWRLSGFSTATGTLKCFLTPEGTEATMQRQNINPWTWQDQFGFVQAINVQGTQRQLVCSGQTSVDADGSPRHPGDMAAQPIQSLDKG